MKKEPLKNKIKRAYHSFDAEEKNGTYSEVVIIHNVKSAVEWLKKDLKDYFDLCKEEKVIPQLEYIINEIHQAFPVIYTLKEELK